jgi:hypothetical protein
MISSSERKMEKVLIMDVRARAEFLITITIKIIM